MKEKILKYLIDNSLSLMDLKDKIYSKYRKPGAQISFRNFWYYGVKLPEELENIIKEIMEEYI